MPVSAPTTEFLIQNPPDAPIGADGANGTRGQVACAAPSAPVSLTLPGRADQVRVIRRWLAELVADLPTADDIVLATSELTANAVRHSDSGVRGSSFTVRVAVGADLVRVEVDDAGGPWGLRPGHAGADQDSLDDVRDQCGRGLAIVACLASDWGIDGDESGRTAWCELPACRGAGTGGRPPAAPR